MDVSGVTMTQLYVALAAASVLFFIGIVTSLVTCFLTVSGLRQRTDRVQKDAGWRFEDVDARFNRMQDSIDLIQRDQKEFYAKQAVHDAKIANLKARRN